MPFGLGFGELLVVLLVFAVPVAILVLTAIFVTRLFRPGRKRVDGIEQHELVNELRQAQMRIEELESRVTRVDEKASFTQDLLEKPRPGQ